MGKNQRKKLYKLRKRWSQLTHEEVYAILPVLLVFMVFTTIAIVTGRAQPVYSDLTASSIGDESLVAARVNTSKLIPQTGRRANPRQSAETTEYVKKRICEVFGEHCADALIIAQYESGYYIMAQSSADARGVFQIHCPAHKKKVGGDCNKLYNLEINLKIAHDIFSAQGWRPWEARRFLPQYRK